VINSLVAEMKDRSNSFIEVCCRVFLLESSIIWYNLVAYLVSVSMVPYHGHIFIIAVT